MKHKIIEQKKNPFMQREEIVVEISAESTPSFADVKRLLGKDDSLTVVQKISSNFGRKNFIAEVSVYDSIESKNKMVVIPQKVRKKMADEAKAKLAAEAKAKAEAAKKAEEDTKKNKVEEKTE